MAHTEGEGVWLSGSQMRWGVHQTRHWRGGVWEEAKLKVFRCESYMLCPVQRGKGLDLLQIPRNQVGVDLFACEENAQESLDCTKGNSSYQFHRGDLAEGRPSGQTRGGRDGCGQIHLSQSSSAWWQNCSAKVHGWWCWYLPGLNKDGFKICMPCPVHR